MATYASIKYDMDLSSRATGTGGMTLLSTQTASSSATIDFTSGIDSTYDEYVFKYINIHPATDQSDFTFQTDTGTNTNYNQSITSTLFGAFNIESGDDDGLFYITVYHSGGNTVGAPDHDGTGFTAVGPYYMVESTKALVTDATTAGLVNFGSNAFQFGWGNYDGGAVENMRNIVVRTNGA